MRRSVHQQYLPPDEQGTWTIGFQIGGQVKPLYGRTVMAYIYWVNWFHVSVICQICTVQSLTAHTINYIKLFLMHSTNK